MVETYILDACALIVYLDEEEGFDKIKIMLEKAARKELRLLMHVLNFLEVYYQIYRDQSPEDADDLLSRMKVLPIEIDRQDLFIRAGKIKATYKLALADAVAVGRAQKINVPLLTTDWTELEVIAQANAVKIYWLRAKYEKKSNG